MATAKKTTKTKTTKDAEPTPEAQPAPPVVPKIQPPEGVTPVSRDQVLAIDDIVDEWVDIPEWHGWMLMRGLDGRGRDAFESSIVIGTGKERKVSTLNMRAKLVAACAIDHMDGNYMFAPMDVVHLGMKSGAALQRAFEVAARLSGISKEDQEGLVKNLESTPSDDSPSDSPSPSEEPEESSSVPLVALK